MDYYDILYLYLFGDGIASYLVLNYDILGDFFDYHLEISSISLF